LFEGPERVPRDLPQPWGTDFFWTGIGKNPNWEPTVEGEDEWGCVWKKISVADKTMGQVRGHPLEDYERLRDFPFPDYDLAERYAQIPEQLKENKENKCVVCGIPLSLIHRLDYLRGTSKALMDPYVNPKELYELLEKMAEIALTSLRHLKDLGIDAIFSCDDWGLQDRPMMSPDVFRKFFKPFYKKVYHQAHEYGMLTFLHSCGHISELLEDFIDAELDVIQMDQQENMGVEKLAARFGGRLCFFCPVDIQNTMVKGSLQDIRNYARSLIERLGCYNGGFIAKWYPSPQAVGHSEERIKVMAEAFVEYGQYKQVAFSSGEAELDAKRAESGHL